MEKEKLEEKMNSKEVAVGCICCPGTPEVLSMDTRLYQGMGGWVIRKDGEIHYMGDCNLEFDEYKQLREIEVDAAKSPKSVWIASVDLPLRAAKYQRSDCGTWALIESGVGFA